ncbi:MAG: SIS domain-containing protein [bacterium]|nr:SIS domain-containing protein [bacterium]
MSHLENEIHEQPHAAARLIERERANVLAMARSIRQFGPEYVVIAARGTSDNAARYAQYLIGHQIGWTVALAAPSLHTLYKTPPNMARALVIGISQSGQSEDVRQVIDDARAQGAMTVSITNDAESPLAKLAGYHLPIHAETEHAVAATKTYTTELIALAMLVAAIRDGAGYEGTLTGLPAAMLRALEQSAAIRDWANEYKDLSRYAVVGRGYNYCTAYEISLKIKELCYVPGEEYSEADFRHGPIAIVKPGFPVIVVNPSGIPFAQLHDLLHKLKERGADTLLITDSDGLGDLARHVLPIPTVEEWLSPILAVIPGQIMAMHFAIARGNPVDAPVGLTKVTNTV